MTLTVYISNLQNLKQTSFVQSISMDSWSHKQILRILEGGSTQLSSFFDRNKLSSSGAGTHSSAGSSLKSFGSNSNNITAGSTTHRYRTKAAQFYREKLGHRVDKVHSAGIYQGRDVSRCSKRVTIGKRAKSRSCKVDARRREEANYATRDAEKKCRMTYARTMTT